MTPEQRRELEIRREIDRRLPFWKCLSYYPKEGPYRRELYPKHMQFFEAGATFRERLFMAGNRTGKTEGGGGLEVMYHATGLYPDWWRGRKFNRPTKGWAAGDTGKTVREIIQEKLLGPTHALGTGLIPKEHILRTLAKSGVPDAIDTVQIKHVSGGVSTLVLKSYDQRRISFQGSEQDYIWLDEEPDIDIYTECLMRTMTNDGLIMLTFTPLSGMSEVVLSFLPGGDIAERAEGSKHVTMATWDDVPHLSEQAKADLMAAIPPFQRDARSKGIPQLGAGAIYPVPESDIVIPDFQIPDHWPRLYGLDVGWKRTSAGFLAHDRDTDCIYRYSEHYRGEAEPPIHAEAIRGRGLWIPGKIDPAARGRGQKDGLQLMQQYNDLGLNLSMANNAVEAGIYESWMRMSTGRFKVFASCQNFRQEYRLYRRDEKGRIVKQNDHAMDDNRYGVMGIAEAIVKPPTEPSNDSSHYYNLGGNGWMAG